MKSVGQDDIGGMLTGISLKTSVMEICSVMESPGENGVGGEVEVNLK